MTPSIPARAFVEGVLMDVASALQKADADSLGGALTARLHEFEKAVGGADFDGILLPIVKFSGDEERMIWGWASVITKNGVPVVDRQNDIIELHELKKAVYDFMDTSRVGGEMHKIMDIGTVVESIVFSNELQKALGINLGREGWFVGVHIDKDSTWEKVKSGEFRSFSLGGKAERVACP